MIVHFLTQVLGQPRPWMCQSSPISEPFLRFGELVVRAPLNDPAFFHDRDLVGVHQRRQAMRDDKHRVLAAPSSGFDRRNRNLLCRYRQPAQRRVIKDQPIGRIF